MSGNAKQEIENVALFDMDGTLCDYARALSLALGKLRSPDEPEFDLYADREGRPRHIKARIDAVCSSHDWWAKLPKFKLGFDVWKLSKELGFRQMILTQGPRSKPMAWAGKVIWINENLGADIDLTVTRDKGLVFGKVLVDDYPDYILRWLKWRHRGLVVMPANRSNEGFEHRQVIRYDGTNLEKVRRAMEIAYKRKGREEVVFQ